MMTEGRGGPGRIAWSLDMLNKAFRHFGSECRYGSHDPSPYQAEKAWRVLLDSYRYQNRGSEPKRAPGSVRTAQTRPVNLPDLDSEATLSSHRRR